MSIVLITPTPLESNAALFKNGAARNQADGSITWDDPFLDNEIWRVTLEGCDVIGDEIAETTIQIDQSETVNPTKVFLWIADKIKTTLCPSCL